MEAIHTIDHTKEFMVHKNNFKMMNYFLMNRPKPGTLGVYAATTWNDQKGNEGDGFIIVDSNANIICGGIGPLNMAWRVEMETVAFSSALSIIRECNGR